METCSADGCDRPVKFRIKGWCHTHYHQWYRRRDQPTSEHRCEACGSGFTGYRKRFCSHDCLMTATKARASAARDAARTILTVTCSECRRQFQSDIPTKRFCSRKCQKRCGDRAKTHLRRLAVGTASESFSASEIFERDHWQCQLCGIGTLRSRRGSSHPRAPELDHIVPLSRGGEHSRRNVQCACRGCNSKKGAALIGQLRMFG